MKTPCRQLSTAFLVMLLGACSQSGENAAQSANDKDVCSTCGVINKIRPVKDYANEENKDVVMGAVVGGLAGGAEKPAEGGADEGFTTVSNSSDPEGGDTVAYYDIIVAMEDGEVQRVRVTDPGHLMIGARVKVQGGAISLR